MDGACACFFFFCIALLCHAVAAMAMSIFVLTGVGSFHPVEDTLCNVLCNRFWFLQQGKCVQPR